MTRAAVAPSLRFGRIRPDSRRRRERLGSFELLTVNQADPNQTNSHHQLQQTAGFRSRRRGSDGELCGEVFAKRIASFNIRQQLLEIHGRERCGESADKWGAEAGTAINLFPIDSERSG
jgi:hypothetical protein